MQRGEVMKKFLRWLKKLFTGNEIQYPIEPVITPETPREPSAGLRIALIRGHGGADSGASGNGTNEVEYNTWVMEFVKKHTTRNVAIFLGSNSINAVTKSKDFKPDVAIQMHLNAYNGTAKGCEVLVVKGDTKSYPIAEKFAKDFTVRFGAVLRRPQDKGKKILTSSDRGIASLVASGNCIKILVEPFFIDNKNDFIPREEYAKFLLEWIEAL
jgi:N-acetylmuramoyl-L-alanine amidase